jgi:cytochrome P450
MSTCTFAAIPGTLFSAVLALLTHPNILTTAYSELTSIIRNPSRTPTFSDHESGLPYINALVHEILRWRPVIVVVLGLAHATTSIDTYTQHRIPAQTTVLVNTYAINTHPDYFPNPDVFEPASFLYPSDPRFRKDVKGTREFPGKLRNYGFGWGRRACAGAGLAGEFDLDLCSKWGVSV